MNDLIRKEIDQQKLPKRALNILHKLDPYINYWSGVASKPSVLRLYAKDYTFLAEKLKDTGQDTTKVAYRGYRLEKYTD